MPGNRGGLPARGSKYQPLADYLASEDGETVSLPLAQIEAILGFPLPTSAYGLAGYWREDASARLRVLRAAGWEPRLHRAEHAVVFTRIPPEE